MRDPGEPRDITDARRTRSSPIGFLHRLLHTLSIAHPGRYSRRPVGMTGRMTAWTADELTKIDNTDELRIAFQRPDGTLAAARTIWVVRDGDDLYVRSVKGRTSGWFRGVQATHQGHVEAGGVSKDVTFADPDDDVDAELDAAYRTKYRRYAANIVNSILTPQARSAAVKLVPR